MHYIPKAGWLAGEWITVCKMISTHRSTLSYRIRRVYLHNAEAQEGIVDNVSGAWCDYGWTAAPPNINHEIEPGTFARAAKVGGFQEPPCCYIYVVT